MGHCGESAPFLIEKPLSKQLLGVGERKDYLPFNAAVAGFPGILSGFGTQAVAEMTSGLTRMAP